MPTKTYIQSGSLIIGEDDGSTRTDFVADGLGSVVGTIQDASLQNTYRYKPFGDDLSSSGGGSEPTLRWVGTQGYMDTGLSLPSHYVRSRHYSDIAGSWTSDDPLASALLRGLHRVGAASLLHLAATARQSYVHNNPTTSVDRLGYDGDGNQDKWEVGDSDAGVGGSIGVDEQCVDFSITVPIKTPWPGVSLDVELSVKVCRSTFDTSECCEPAASTCWTVTISLAVTVTLEIPGLDIFDLGDDFDKFWKGLLKFFNDLLNGFLDTAWDLSHRAKGCPKPGRECQFDVCITGKLDLCSASYCTDDGFDFDCDWWGDWLGGISLTIEVKITCKECK